MAAARYDITIDQGSDFSLELIVKESGVARSFADDTRAKFRKTFDDTTSFDLGAAVTQTAAGKVTLTHSFSDNPSATAGTYVYDLEIFQHTTGDTSAVHQVTRLLTGNLTLRREVTR